MKDDPIVAEVRMIREQRARECDCDIGKLMEKEREFFRQWKGKKITVPFHPEWRAPKPADAIVAEDRPEYGCTNDDGKP